MYIKLECSEKKQAKKNKKICTNTFGWTSDIYIILIIYSENWRSGDSATAVFSQGHQLGLPEEEHFKIIVKFEREREC